MKYFRVHTSDIAWLTKQPRGIFTTVGKLVDAKTLTKEETTEYWKQREYFEKVLPVPPFYEQGNPIVEQFYSNCSGTYHFIPMDVAIDMKYYAFDKGLTNRFAKKRGS